MHKKLILVGLLVLILIIGCQNLNTKDIRQPLPQVQPNTVGGGCSIEGIDDIESPTIIQIPLWVRL